jgi:hypothetical protein
MERIAHSTKVPALSAVVEPAPEMPVLFATPHATTLTEPPATHRTHGIADGDAEIGSHFSLRVGEVPSVVIGADGCQSFNVWLCPRRMRMLNNFDECTTVFALLLPEVTPLVSGPRSTDQRYEKVQALLTRLAAPHLEPRGMPRELPILRTNVNRRAPMGDARTVSGQPQTQSTCGPHQPMRQSRQFDTGGDLE